MSEADQTKLRETFAAIVEQAQAMQAHLSEQLSAFSPDRYPRTGTRLECLMEGLGGVEAMAALAGAHVGDDAPVHV